MRNNEHGVFSRELVERTVRELHITSLENATIGEVLLLASRLEELTGIPFIRMDQGVPGLPPCRIGLEAEKAALDTGIAAIYPAAEGIPELKRETSRFVKAFLNVDVSPASCIPFRQCPSAASKAIKAFFLSRPSIRFLQKRSSATANKTFPFAVSRRHLYALIVS